jgi:5-deoxy-D-glucuronate isomerase
LKTIFFRKNHPKEGYTSLVSKENTYLNDLEIGRLRLGKKGDKFSGHTKNHELLLEILIGTCDITTKHNDSVKKFHAHVAIFRGKSSNIRVGFNSYINRFSINPLVAYSGLLLMYFDVERSTFF